MRDWYEGLAPRERLLITIGGAAFVVIMLWSQAWLPLTRAVEEAQQSQLDQQALLSWIEQQVPKLEAVRAAGNGENTPSALSQGQLLLLADRGAKAIGLGDSIQRSNPESGGGVRVVLEDAQFDLVVRWLAELAREHGITVANMVTTAKDVPGQVDARVSLTAPGAGLGADA